LHKYVSKRNDAREIGHRICIDEKERVTTISYLKNHSPFREELFKEVASNAKKIVCIKQFKSIIPALWALVEPNKKTSGAPLK